MISPSPWPILSSLLVLNTFSSFLLFFLFSDMFIFFNLIFLLSSVFMWWFDYSSELNFWGLDFLNSVSMIKMGMIMFIMSEVMLFFSFFWGYFHFHLCPSMPLGSLWPSKLILMFDWFNIPMLNTLLLVCSSVTLTISHYYLSIGSKTKCNSFLYLTIILGLFFSSMQYLEYRSSFFSISDSTFGSIFFMLTGLHGLHVLMGTSFLIVTAFRIINFMSSKSNLISFELSSWYWHFVDVVWIYVFYFLYLINS